MFCGLVQWSEQTIYVQGTHLEDTSTFAYRRGAGPVGKDPDPATAAKQVSTLKQQFCCPVMMTTCIVWNSLRRRNPFAQRFFRLIGKTRKRHPSGYWVVQTLTCLFFSDNSIKETCRQTKSDTFNNCDKKHSDIYADTRVYQTSSTTPEKQ